MGYRYFYQMQVRDLTEEQVETIVNILEKHSDYTCEYCYNNNSTTLIMLDEVSWDDPTDALKEISQLFPDRVFELVYCGADWDDRGSIYAKNGKTQTCVILISYEEPDEYFKQ